MDTVNFRMLIIDNSIVKFGFERFESGNNAPTSPADKKLLAAKII